MLFIQTQTNFAKFVIRKYLQFYTYYRYFVFHSYLRNGKKRQDQHDFLQKEIVPSRRLTTNSKCRLPVNQGCPAYLPVGTFLARNTPASSCFSSCNSIREDASVRKRSTDYFKAQESGYFTTEIYTFVFERSPRKFYPNTRNF